MSVFVIIALVMLHNKPLQNSVTYINNHIFLFTCLWVA